MHAHGPDYLSLPIAWLPSRRFEHGQPYEYRLALTGDDVAILHRVAGRGWALMIAHGAAGPATARGLFGTPHDALMVLYAERAAALLFRASGHSTGELVGDL